jgi:TM2 domain-containing membrane protein YozV
MCDYKFNCPHCQQPLEASEDILGETIECPACHGTTTLSKSELQQKSNLPPSPPTTKTCPFCFEQILPTALKCKHCGEFLDPSLRRSRIVSSPAAPQFVRLAKSRGVYIILGLFLGGLFGIHNFYAGYYGTAAIQLLIILFLGWTGVGIGINLIWVLIEVCTITVDGNGNPMI